MMENIQMGGNEISIDEARELVKNFTSSKRVALMEEGGKDFEETCCVWFSKETICQLLGIDASTVSKASGIRMYFAAYPQSTGDVDKDNKLTLVLSRTSGASEDDEVIDGTTNAFANFGGLIPPPYKKKFGLFEIS